MQPPERNTKAAGLQALLQCGVQVAGRSARAAALKQHGSVECRQCRLPVQAAGFKAVDAVLELMCPRRVSTPCLIGSPNLAHWDRQDPCQAASRWCWLTLPRTRSPLSRIPCTPRHLTHTL